MNIQIKKISKLVVSLILCLAMVMTLGAHAAQAKSKRGKFTVTYKGKTITLITTKTNKKNAGIIAMSNAKEIKKAWKKPTKIKKDYGNTYYIYKKGKSKISFNIDTKWGDGKGGIDKSLTLGGFDISIKDKNAKLCGVQVGMSKNKALKILKKNYDKKAVESDKNGINLWFGPYMPVSYQLKNNKVVSMSFWSS